VRMPAAGTSDAVAGLKCRRSAAALNGADSLSAAGRGMGGGGNRMQIYYQMCERTYMAAQALFAARRRRAQKVRSTHSGEMMTWLMRKKGS
jgi:hypothetical protein